MFKHEEKISKNVKGKEKWHETKAKHKGKGKMA